MIKEHRSSKFEPFGPFDIPVSGALIDRKREAEFWKTVDAIEHGLPDAVGCYIFAIRAGKGVRPWYIGEDEFSKGVVDAAQIAHIFGRITAVEERNPAPLFHR